MRELRVREAINIAKANGIKVKKGELACVLWPNSTASGAKCNLCNMEANKMKKITIEQVSLLCNILGVSADFLFGLTDNPVPIENGRAAIREESLKILEAAEIIKETIK